MLVAVVISSMCLHVAPCERVFSDADSAERHLQRVLALAIELKSRPDMQRAHVLLGNFHVQQIETLLEGR